jgi:myo-inositol-1(or 4)-monophosphatase
MLASVSAAPDWLELCRRAAAAGGAALDQSALGADRSRTAGRGEGGDQTLVIDRAVEDAVFAELESLEGGLTAISEERGQVEINGGGPLRVVIDPIDGSRNAKRDLPLYALSLAVAEGPTMVDVSFAFVHDFARNEDWWAQRDQGAYRDGERLSGLEDGGGELELLGLETAEPAALRDAAAALAAAGPRRLRALGSVALSLCYVAAGRLDAMLSLAPTRSVDAAAGQLLVREAGGEVSFPDAGDEEPLSAPLDLDMRSRVLAATSRPALDRLLGAFG